MDLLQVIACPTRRSSQKPNRAVGQSTAAGGADAGAGAGASAGAGAGAGAGAAVRYSTAMVTSPLRSSQKPYTQSKLRTVPSHTRFVGFGFILRQPHIEFDACLSQGLDQASDIDVFLLESCARATSNLFGGKTYQLESIAALHVSSHSLLSPS